MMYENKLVASVKVGGKVLREYKDKVYVPYGSEYSIFIKNLNAVRAMVKISIDDKDILGGDSLVVGANSSIDIERYLTNLNKGNRFKFIERTSSVENHRGVGSSDGIIRIEFQYEKFRIQAPITRSYMPDGYYGDVSSRRVTDGAWGSTVCGSSGMMYNSVFASSVTQPKNEVGITVPGSISNQQFQTVSSFEVENESYVIVLQLLGETETQKVIKPVVVKKNVNCVTCGKVNKQTSSFCSNCGTSLSIV